MPAKKTSRPFVYDMTSQECIWSAAGVVPYRLCDAGFDCTGCSFDQRMQRKGARSWRDRTRAAASSEVRRCRHMLSGYITAKYCPNNFDCANCEFDQLVEEEMRTQHASEPEVRLLEGFALALEHYYSSAHTWARVEYGGQIRIGLDDFAARTLGPAERWDLPQLGSTLDQGEAWGTLFRDENQATLRCPVQGIVLAVNPRLRARPELVNTAPYGQGWVMILQPTRLVRDLRRLRFGEEAERWLQGEAQRLFDLVHRESQYRLAATGARVVQDVYGAVEGLQWDELLRSFLAA
jgi:glycine cleavage system H lipoate-binding protein